MVLLVFYLGNMDISQMWTCDTHFIFSNESSIYTEKVQLPPLKTNVLLFPNPVSGLATVYIPHGLEASSTRMDVYNYSGKQAFSQNLSAQDPMVNFSNLDSGLYFILLADQYGKTAVQKFMKVVE